MLNTALLLRVSHHHSFRSLKLVSPIVFGAVLQFVSRKKITPVFGPVVAVVEVDCWIALRGNADLYGGVLL